MGAAGCSQSDSPQAETSKELKAADPAPPVDAAVEPGDPAHPPDEILLASEYGDVVFTHRKHYERVNGDCSTCHPAVFPMSLAPLDYGKARHRVAEEYQTSCATCHGINTEAFTSERNCERCHDISHGKRPK